jgi:hypothetical protein
MEVATEAITVANKLDAENEARMREFAATLTEKDRRRFAAFEAKQQGYGAIEYIAGIIGCSRRTIKRGIAELDHLDQDPAAGQVPVGKNDFPGLRSRTKPEIAFGDSNGGRS